MNGFDLVHADQWLLGPLFDSEHPFFAIQKDTIIATWITLGIITVLLLVARYLLSRKGSLGHFMVINTVQFFVDLVQQSLPNFSFDHFVFITTAFCFVLMCNVVSIVPYMHEPTTDLNTTLALGITAFLYTQWAAIRSLGLWHYIKGYFSPFFIMLPLNIVGKLATVVSISFRLFGNIFGGSIISTFYFQAIQGTFILEMLGLLSGMNLLMMLFFGIFEGCLQAFVFSMLSLTYLSLAIQGEGH